MAFPNLGQMPASTGVGMPGRLAVAVKKPVVKKPAMDPKVARQALVRGMKGC